MFKYETHLHTKPVSKCASATVREQLEYYKAQGYDGVFITNHFIDRNSNVVGGMTYDEQMDYCFSDYEEAFIIGKELGIKVFCGVESSYLGTDFLIYGLDKAWFKSHPEIKGMRIKDKLTLWAENGALIIQAHPFREAGYISHIRLFPRNIHGTEIVNACRNELENKMAGIYAEEYGLIPFAGSDNHRGAGMSMLAGMKTEDKPIDSEAEFIAAVLSGEATPFVVKL
jgi:predicted metal-dependent phosphoesterase TrpH